MCNTEEIKIEPCQNCKWWPKDSSIGPCPICGGGGYVIVSPPEYVLTDQPTFTFSVDMKQAEIDMLKRTILQLEARIAALEAERTP